MLADIFIHIYYYVLPLVCKYYVGIDTWRQVLYVYIDHISYASTLASHIIE